jgi:hypothetical protein
MFVDNLSVPLKGQVVFLECMTTEDGPIGCPEILVNNYQAALHKITELQRFHLHHSRRLKSQKIADYLHTRHLVP